jgi:CBS domain containing-hemolysin-like protein
MNLLDLLTEFRKGKSHMAFITEEVKIVQSKLGLNMNNSILPEHLVNGETTEKYIILGIITLEDVLEEMINFEIKDEDDYDEDSKTKGRTISIITTSNFVY